MDPGSALAVLACPGRRKLRLHDDLGVPFRIGQIRKRLRDAVDADACRHQRGRINLFPEFAQNGGLIGYGRFLGHRQALLAIREGEAL